MKIIDSQIVVVPRNDIDTDLIIPASYLKTTSRTGLGKGLFANLREMDKNFPFNLKKYHEAKILITGENFGCGSSREHAAWALNDWGIRVVIAPSFADIFFNNAMKNQVLPIILSAQIIQQIIEDEKRNDSYKVTIDLPNQTVTTPDGHHHHFDIDPYRKNCLIEEIDDLKYLLANTKEIESFDQKHAKHIFFNHVELCKSVRYKAARKF